MTGLGPHLRRALVAGPLWLLVLFVIDSAASFGLLQRSTAHIADPETTALLARGVADYVLQMIGAYLVLGLLAVPALALALAMASPTVPSRRRWWATALGLIVAVSALGNARQMSTFPPLHDWFPWRAWWVDTVAPEQVDAVGGVLLVVALALTWRRWPVAERGALAVRAALLTAWMSVVGLVLAPPVPDEPPANAGPNLLVIGIDALRPDHLGAFGYPLDTSPRIDALLAESAVFESAWSPLARTYPAWISTLSGSLPITHGVRDNLPESEALVPAQALLPQVMRDAGWHTRFVTDDSRFSYMVPETGFEHIRQPPVGVQNFAVSVNEPRYRAFHGLLHNPLGFSLVPTTEHNQAFGKSYHPDRFVDAAVQELAEAAQHERFFMAIHSCVLHAPGDRVRPWTHMYGQEGYRGANRFRYSRSGTTLVAYDEEKGLSVEEVAAQDVRIYDSGIDMADRLVGALTAALEDSGLAENTVVVLMSDHGEELWSPELPYRYTGPNHGFHAYGEAQFRVALALRSPDGAHAGERVSAPVRLIDLAPTLAEHFGLDWPNATDGRSMLPLLAGAEEAPRPVYIETGLSEPRYWVKGHRRYPFRTVSERYSADPETGRVHIRPKFKPQLIAAKDRAVVVGPWKLVWLATTDGGRVELFNRGLDPLNLRDLSDKFPDRVADLAAVMRPYLEADGIDTSALPELSPDE